MTTFDRTIHPLCKNCDDNCPLKFSQEYYKDCPKDLNYLECQVAEQEMIDSYYGIYECPPTVEED